MSDWWLIGGWTSLQVNWSSSNISGKFVSNFSSCLDCLFGFLDHRLLFVVIKIQYYLLTNIFHQSWLYHIKYTIYTIYTITNFLSLLKYLITKSQQCKCLRAYLKADLCAASDSFGNINLPCVLRIYHNLSY